MSDEKSVDTRVEMSPDISKFLTSVFKSPIIEYSLKMKIRIALNTTIDDRTFSYDVLNEAHEFYSKLQKNPDDKGYIELRDLVKTSRVFNRNISEPVRSPELVKRLNRLKREQEQKEYDQMVTNVVSSKKLNLGKDVGAAYRTAKQQTMSVMNLVISVVAAFMFGNVASQYAFSNNLGARIILGIFMACVVAIADLYFMARVEI